MEGLQAYCKQNARFSGNFRFKYFFLNFQSFVQAEMIHFGDRRKDANVNCYEKIGDRVMRPIIEFLTGTCVDYNPLFKPIG